MLLRKAAATTLVLTLLLAALGALWVYFKKPTLFSDPAAARKNDTYTAALNPVTNASGVATNFPVIEGATTEFEIFFSVPTKPAAHETEGPVTVVRGKGGESIPLSGGTIQLKYIASGWPASMISFTDGMELPARFYTGDAVPVPADRLDKGLFEDRQTVYFRGSYPGANFFFTHTNLPGLKVLSFQAFDARTKSTLWDGYISSSRQNSFWYGTEVQLWHQTPIELVLTVAIGPPQTNSLAPEKGARLHLPRGEIQLVEKVAGTISSTSTMMDAKTRVVLRRSSPTDRDASTSTTFIYYLWPRPQNPYELVCISHDGKPLETIRSSSSGQLVTISVRGTPDTVKELRVITYPNLYRLVLTIPELPGLPEENRHLKNLFDARIPYIKIEREDELLRTIGRLTALEIPALSINYTNIIFPLIRTNITARDLMNDVAQHLSAPEEALTVNQHDHKIEVKRPVLFILWERLKKLFR